MPNWKEADTSYAAAYWDVDFREHPELYRIGKGQQGVLMAQPYKSEILAIGWRFRTPEIAEESSANILAAFYRYLDAGDFVGADMAKKYLHMGYTRSRRYANHKSGQKYDVDMTVLPQEPDALTSPKAESARIFYGRWLTARTDPRYTAMRDTHRRLYGG